MIKMRENPDFDSFFCSCGRRIYFKTKKQLDYAMDIHLHSKKHDEF